MPTDLPKVSIVMNVYKQRRDWFMVALDSLYKQTYPNKQIIVSTVRGDPANEWAGVFPGVEIVENNFPDAKEQINAGIKWASGEYVVFICSDDFVYPNAIATMVKTALENDSVLVHSDIHYCDEDLNILLGNKTVREFDYKKLKQLQVINDFALVKKSVYWEFGLLKTEWKKFAFWEMWLQIGLKYPDRIHHTGTCMLKYRRHLNSLSIRATHGNAEDRRVTGEDLRDKFYSQYDIEPDIKNETIGNWIVTTYGSGPKIILDKTLVK